MKGKFITFEGGEGCGKSTHIRLLAEHLRLRGIEVVLTREPGGTPLCEAIRGLLMFDTAEESPAPAAETLLFCASRAQLVEQVIKPALERGAWVLSDRFSDSTIAYQGYGRGFDLNALNALLDFATGGLKPDMTFLLTVSPETETARLRDRYAGGESADRMEREKSEFHKRVAEGFKALLVSEPERIKEVSTDGECCETSAKILSFLSAVSGV